VTHTGPDDARARASCAPRQRYWPIDELEGLHVCIDIDRRRVLADLDWASTQR
jgi:hypothetical protein